MTADQPARDPRDVRIARENFEQAILDLFELGYSNAEVRDLSETMLTGPCYCQLCGGETSHG